MTRKTVVKVTTLAVLITVVGGCMAVLRVRNSFVPSVDYSTSIDRGPQKVINAPGSVQAVVTVPVGNKGRVQELFADTNSVVKRGQRPSYIHLQFLTESGVPSLTGGIAGRFIGGSAAAHLPGISSGQASCPLWRLQSRSAFRPPIGVFFGYYPADERRCPNR